jgi:queuosine precursor transporter
LSKIILFPKMLWFLQISFVSVILLANWFDIRLIQLGFIITDAGTLIFPLTFIISDLITEVYGYKHARRAIWVGFLFNLFFIGYSQLIIHLPSPGFAFDVNTKFASLLEFNARIILASIASYLLCEPLNSYTMAKLKLKTKGKYMWLRFISSTVIASFCDSFIFGSLAFAMIMPVNELIKFNLMMWLVKVVVEICGLPLSLTLANKLKQYEQLDIYDRHTKFSLFSLEVGYAKDNNQYAANQHTNKV